MASGLKKTRRYLLSRAKQYHRRPLLDDRVRNGNGYGQVPIVTGNTRLRRMAQPDPRVGSWKKGELVTTRQPCRRERCFSQSAAQRLTGKRWISRSSD